VILSRISIHVNAWSCAYFHQVALGSPVGSPELLSFDKLAASNIASHPEFLTSTPVLRSRPTCLLVVSSVRHSQNHRPGDAQADLSQDLFGSLSTPSAGASDPEYLAYSRLVEFWRFHRLHFVLVVYLISLGGSMLTFENVRHWVIFPIMIALFWTIHIL